MKSLNGYRIMLVVVGCVAVIVLGSANANADDINQAPIADAGLPRYAAQDPVVLDGTGSYDLDDSSTLNYIWRQTSGPSVEIGEANTASPTISGFVQTDEIQKCEFELVVSDGELTSLPDSVKVVIVPDFGENTLRLANDSFDPGKPTFVWFQGGNCIIGSPYRVAWSSDWLSLMNIIDFPEGFVPDSGSNPRTYYDYGDMIIVYLSSVAPDYKMSIQTCGISTGGQPAIDVGMHLNLTYQDARYAVNRVTFEDATGYCRDYSESISVFLTSSVEGEQCWIDNYVGTLAGAGANPGLQYPSFHPDVLNVLFDKATDSSLSWLYRHQLPAYWYGNSLTGSDMNRFNNGVVAGAYWSVAGPGKNLQLASTPGVETYKFTWYGDASSGYIDFFDESLYPDRLPEPVTLVGPENGAIVDANGAMFSCEESENAIRYQLLFGRDPYHMVYMFSDTPSPPSNIVTSFPFEQTWWTVKAYDQYGSTIHADPVHINAESVVAQTIENATTGQTYASIQQAINDALAGDEIVVNPGTHQYLEHVNFKGKNLTVRSTDPSDPVVVAATVINGGQHRSVINLSGSQVAGCVLAGLTITGGIVGISCDDASPTIRNCTIGSNGPNAIEFWEGYEPPTIIDCTIIGKVAEVEGYDPTLVAHWALDEEEGTKANDSAGTFDGRFVGDPVWQPAGGIVDGALQLDGVDDFILTGSIPNLIKGPFSVFAWVKGGAPGQVVISQRSGVNWLCADTLEGNLMTELMGPGRDVAILPSQAVITDGNWHRIGLVWDGSHRTLYLDDLAVAEDTLANLEVSENSLLIGTGNVMKSGTYWSGLIDDVRIYKRAVRP